MKQYAMVPICSKEDDLGNPIIRRVLIEFDNTISSENKIDFTGTRFVDCDPYFYKENSSHKYLFEDDGYSLKTSNNVMSMFYSPSLYEKRKYHCFVSLDILKPPAIIFTADSDEEAKRQFHQRDEKRD